MKIKFKSIFPFIVVFISVVIFIFCYNFINQKNKNLKSDSFSDEMSQNQKIGLVEEYVYNNDLNSAIKLLNELINDNTLNNELKSQLYLRLAEVYEKQNNYGFSVGCYKLAIENSTSNSNSELKHKYVDLIVRYNLKDYFVDAKEIILDWISVDKYNSTNYVHLSSILIGEENYDLAFENLHMALSYDKNNVEAYKSLAYLYIIHSEYDIAIENLLKASKIDFKDGEIPNLIANAYYLSERSKEALEWFKVSVDKDKYISDNYFKLHNIYLNKNDKTAAINELDKAKKLFKDTKVEEKANKLLEDLLPKIYN